MGDDGWFAQELSQEDAIVRALHAPTERLQHDSGQERSSVVISDEKRRGGKWTRRSVSDEIDPRMLGQLPQRQADSADQEQAVSTKSSASLARPYVAQGSDELDKTLEASLADMGADVLKGNRLIRTGPSKYKLGDKRIFMKLTDGQVSIRDGSRYISLANWLEDLQVAADVGDVSCLLILGTDILFCPAGCSQ